MAIANLKSLIGKLNTTCRKSLESAAGLCLSHTHYDVELEHFFIKLLDINDTDLQKILRYFEINESHLVGDLTRTIEEFKRGNSRTPSLSPRIPQMIQEAWLVASVDFGADSIRSGHIVLALLANDEAARGLAASSSLFKKISVETLRQSFADLTAGSVEESEAVATAGARPASAGGAAGVAAGKGQALAQYTDQPDRQGEKGGDRSGAGPRCGDPPDGGYPHPAAAEQPHSHR